jgi:hypothetical protein
MCDEVIFRGRYLHTIEDLQSALGGGEIVPNRRCSYTDDDLLPHCCLCPVDLEQTAAKNGLRLWPSSGGEGVWILSGEDSHPEPGRCAHQHAQQTKEPFEERNVRSLHT